MIASDGDGENGAQRKGRAKTTRMMRSALSFQTVFSAALKAFSLSSSHWNIVFFLCADVVMWSRRHRFARSEPGLKFALVETPLVTNNI
ncbi:hypothetical protein [Herbaspirillum lusitanum]|uniref:hypothetical protein n=1 Tax=Herbaspirillum lusitanum TaxID=213312 RepID=UPI0012F49B8E|nr:hypothetical protein [Herbaspirillum lusitanum]